MTSRVRAASSVVLVMACLMLCVSSAQACVVSPLPASDYTVAVGVRCARSRARGLPGGNAGGEDCGCAGLHPPVGDHEGPCDHGGQSRGRRRMACARRICVSAYFPGEHPDAPASEPQTIALVDAYDDPNAEADLEVYDGEFLLPACTDAQWMLRARSTRTAKPAIRRSPKAIKPRPKEALCESARPNVGQASGLREVEEADGWALETSLDIEIAHAICQNCHMSCGGRHGRKSASGSGGGHRGGESIGATEVSNSWGGEEPPTDSEAFDHPGIVITVRRRGSRLSELGRE